MAAKRFHVTVFCLSPSRGPHCPSQIPAVVSYAHCLDGKVPSLLRPLWKLY